MNYRVFGRRTGLKVSPLVLGTGLLGQASGYGATPEDVQAILRGYAEAGGNFFDTSDAHQGGGSEATIGEFIAPNRGDFVVASKYSRGAGANTAPAAGGAHRKAMVQSVEGSLKRLKTDYLDLYLVHADDGLTPVEEIMRGLDDLTRAGKILYGGFSNYAAWRVALASAIADGRGWSPVSAIEIEYSLLQRTTERELMPMADGLGIGVLGYSPLAGGLLTGKYRQGETGRATEFKAGISHEDAGRSAATIDALLAVAEDLGIAPGQAALAWVMAKGVFPIIGPRTPAQLADNLAAAALRLSLEHVRRLDEASAVPPGYPHELNAQYQARQNAAHLDQTVFRGPTVA